METKDILFELRSKTDYHKVNLQKKYLLPARLYHAEKRVKQPLIQKH